MGPVSGPKVIYEKLTNSPRPLIEKINGRPLCCDHVIIMDLHASQIQGFFDFAVDNLYSEPQSRAGRTGSSLVRTLGVLSGLCFSLVPSVSIPPSQTIGCSHRSVTAIADKLGLESALFHRKRVGKTEDAPEKMELLVGKIKDKVSFPSLSFTLHSRPLNVFPYRRQCLVDDMIDTGTTLTLAAWSLKENGASRNYVLVSRGRPFYPVSFLLLSE